MQLSRRKFLAAATGAAAPAGLSPMARAEGYPTRPLRWLVGFPPGGPSDTVARVVAQPLADRLGQQIVVENKPGAATNISVEAAVNAPADGYTLLFLTASAAVNVTLFDNLPFNLLTDIVPIAGVADFPLMMVVNPSVPVRSVAEFIAYAKSNPGKISMASFGTGSTSHVAGALFMTMTGITMLHVPYSGEAPALIDLIAGRVQVMFPTLTGSISYIRSGALRLIAAAGKSRNEFLPDTPTIGETLPGYAASSWCGLAARHGTPAEIIARLNTEINAVLAQPAIKARLATIDTTPMICTPSEFGAFIAGEVDKWGKVIREANIKPG
jgi:tripartite-type tricarboxylate transporter receptor subunit TctC